MSEVDDLRGEVCRILEQVPLLNQTWYEERLDKFCCYALRLLDRYEAGMAYPAAPTFIDSPATTQFIHSVTEFTLGNEVRELAEALGLEAK